MAETQMEVPGKHSGQGPLHERRQGLERLSTARCLPTRALPLAVGSLVCAVFP